MPAHTCDLPTGPRELRLSSLPDGREVVRALRHVSRPPPKSLHPIDCLRSSNNDRRIISIDLFRPQPGTATPIHTSTTTSSM